MVGLPVPGRTLTRKQFLGVSAGVALAPTLARAERAARLLRRRDIERVKHVVILMQENISFNHYFGTLAGVRGFSDPKALTLPNGHSVFEQPYPLTLDGFLRPWAFDSSTANPCTVLPDNSWDARHAAWASGRMNGFVGATAGTPNYFTMAYYPRGEIPWHMALADGFCVCDRYFSSVLGPTDPNRVMMWTGTIDPYGRHGGPEFNNQANDTTRYTWKTYPERLTKAGVSWRVYHEADDFDDNSLKYFAAYQDAKPKSTLYRSALVNRPADAFARDVAGDRLPHVSWIVAPTKASEHPLVSAPGYGADYCNQIFRALRAHPHVWAKTVVIFNYDEDGGYFDHVRPPTAPAGTKQEFIGNQPIGLGFRVPAIVCSPWTRGRLVCSRTFDHTSLIRFLERRFGVHEPQISAWRRRLVGDLWECFDFRRPDYSFPKLPPTAAGVAATDRACAVTTPPALPRLANGPQPGQEPGTRRRRG